MPTYDYYCNKCENTFDKLLPIADRQTPTTEPCPNCTEQNSVELKIGAPSPVDPLRLEGRNRPRSDFRDRMQQIKSVSGKRNNIKDY